MKKRFGALLLVVLLVMAAGCSKVSDGNESQGETPSAPNSTTPNNKDDPSTLLPFEELSEPGESVAEELMIQVSDGTNMTTFKLNDSTAAKVLYEQLPLSLEVQDYSNNEKIFYPTKALDVSDAPKASGEIGTLAYYSPWADVVMFFGSYSPNGSLYELGQVASGSEQIQLLEGTITIEVAP